MKYQRDRAWMEVSLDAIEENFYKIQKEIGENRGIIGVIKANAYGLGAVPIARLLEKLGCDMFAVACIEEAMELRENQITTPILTLGPVIADYAALCSENGIEIPVMNLAQAKELSASAVKANVTVNVHIKTDAGLSRFGLRLMDFEASLADVKAIFALPNLSVKAIFTHYTGADIPEGEQFNKAQIALFDRFCQALYDLDYAFKKHSASSLFTEIYPQSYNDYVRTAALLLGLEGPAIRGISATPSASLKAKIYEIKDLPMGIPISYGPLTYTIRDTKIAIIPLGFADGLRRSIQNRASFMVKGKWAPIIGKICMDYLMLDITDIEDVKVGDTVTVFGRDGDLHQEVWELAEIYPGSVGEVTATLVQRIPRFYVRNGEIIGRLD